MFDTKSLNLRLGALVTGGGNKRCDLRLYSPESRFVRAWKERADAMKKNSYALYLASRDPRVPVFAKVLIGMVVAYALSPIDLIPDFIPVVGYLDDLLILPFGIWIALRLVPDDVWAECRNLAGERVAEMPHSRRAAVVILIVWGMAIVAVVSWIGSIYSDTGIR